MFNGIKDLLTIASIEIYFFVFWFIPRKFKLSAAQLILDEDEVGGLQFGDENN